IPPPLMPATSFWSPTYRFPSGPNRTPFGSASPPVASGETKTSMNLPVLSKRSTLGHLNRLFSACLPPNGLHRVLISTRLQFRRDVGTDRTNAGDLLPVEENLSELIRNPQLD